jgi:hypothetical protein
MAYGKSKSAWPIPSNARAVFGAASARGLVAYERVIRNISSYNFTENMEYPTKSYNSQLVA